MPSLETKRLRLRRLAPSDLDPLVELDADPEVMRYLNGGVPTPRAILRNEILPRLLGSHARFPHAGFWAVTSPTDGTFLGYRFRSEVWHRGYATEAARALIDRFFREIDGHRVYATTYEGNLASRRVAEKLGMTLVRRFRLTSDQ
jgi:RimJ/RimL family protein N-acetyltransferase